MEITVFVLMCVATFSLILIAFSLLRISKHLSKIRKTFALFKRDQDIGEINLSKILGAFNKGEESNKEMAEYLKQINEKFKK